MNPDDLLAQITAAADLRATFEGLAEMLATHLAALTAKNFTREEAFELTRDYYAELLRRTPTPEDD